MHCKALPRLFSVVFFLLLLQSTAQGKSWGVWPLFSYYTAEGQQEWEVLGPIFTWKAGKEGKEWGIRPLFCHTDRPSEELWRWEFLYPLGKYQRYEEDLRFYAVPFSVFRDEATYVSRERREKASSILTAFWGQTGTGERYGGVFPFAGRLKDRFGRDEMEFYVWPLYSRVEDEGTTTWRIFWPFFSLIRGEVEGHYIWPLWGRKVKAGVHSRGFFLWPLYVYVDEDLDTDDPVRKRYYLPLYASARSGQGKIDCFLPLLFFHQRWYSPPFNKWDFPWPFVTLVKGEGVEELKVFPIFRLRREVGKKRFFFLWPLYTYEIDETDRELEEIYRLFLINKYKLVREIDTGRESIDTNLWPLFDYRRGFSGEVQLYIFPFFPFRDEGMQRNIYPLFWVYRYNRSAGGEVLSDLLWGLYRRRVSPQTTSTQLAFLLRSEKKENGDLSLSFLEGLFRYERTKEGRKLGFLFIDF